MCMLKIWIVLEMENESECNPSSHDKAKANRTFLIRRKRLHEVSRREKVMRLLESLWSLLKITDCVSRYRSPLLAHRVSLICQQWEEEDRSMFEVEESSKGVGLE